MATGDLSLVLASFLILSISSADSAYKVGCPSAKDIEPCQCFGGAKYISNLVCESIYDTQDLIKIFQNASGRTYEKLSFKSINVHHIPAEIFSRAKFRNLHVQKSTLTKLFDESPSELSDLIEFRLDNVRIKNGFNWDSLSGMKKLRNLYIHGIPIPHIGKEFASDVSKSLIFLALARTKTETIDSEAFKKFNLTYLSIINTQISQVHRSILPSPSAIKFLHLEKNRISSFPEDMFEGMPRLRSLGVSNNQLTSLPENTFRRVWDQLRYFLALGNRFKCDCRMKWILDPSPLAWLSGSCSSPKKLYGRHLRDLTANDFQC